jgi:hypothetical protein
MRVVPMLASTGLLKLLMHRRLHALQHGVAAVSLAA